MSDLLQALVFDQEEEYSPLELAIHLGAGARLFEVGAWHGLKATQMHALVFTGPASSPARHPEQWAMWMLEDDNASTCAQLFNVNESWLRSGACTERRITSSADPQAGEAFTRGVQWGVERNARQNFTELSLPKLELWFTRTDMDELGFNPEVAALVQETRRGGTADAENAVVSYRLRLDTHTHGDGEFHQAVASLLLSGYPLRAREVGDVQLHAVMLGTVHPVQVARKTKTVGPEDDDEDLLEVLKFWATTITELNGRRPIPMLSYGLLHVALGLSPEQRQDMEYDMMKTRMERAVERMQDKQTAEDDVDPDPKHLN